MNRCQPLDLRFRTILPALLILSSCLRLAYATPADSLRHEVLTTWTTDQGLPQNFVRAITQTSDGFLWIGTMNGLARFDGLRFRTFLKDGPPELQQNIVNLTPDSTNGLWIATATVLLHYSQQRYTPIPLLDVGSRHDRSKDHYRIEAMTRSSDGEVWIYTGGKLLHTHHGVFEAVGLPASAQSLRDLTEAADHTLWIADGEGLFALRGHIAPIHYPLPGVRMVYADDFGDVYAGDGHRLFRLDGNTFRPVPHPGLDNFVNMLVDSRHRLWMASGGLHGISRNDHGNLETLTVADGLATNDVRLIFEDHGGDLWLGTISGLQRLHHGSFTTYTARDGLPGDHSQFAAVFRQQNGSIWAGTLEGGIAEFAHGRWHSFPRSQRPPAGQVRGFIEAGDTPWVAIADYGIFAFRDGRFSRLPSLPNGYITTPLRMPDGSVWFGMEHLGLFRRRDSQLTRFGPAEGLPNEAIWSLILSEGSISQGSMSQGSMSQSSMDQDVTLRVAAGNQLLRWDHERFLPEFTSPSPILCAAWPRIGDPDSGGPRSGSGALGTLNGLLLRTAARSRMLTEREGLPGDTVLDLFDDNEGNLWIVTTRSISRLSKAQWTAFADRQVDRVYPEIFTQADGLKSNTVLPRNQITAARGLDGRLWFATPAGISVVDPNLPPEPTVPAIIDSVTVDDLEQPASEALAVPPGQHRITFAYTTPPAAAPEQIRFRYRLTGWDNHWIDAADSREVSYTALPPGTYTFEVSAITRSNNFSPGTAKLSLVLKPFFWQTRWFLVLVIFVAASIIVEITRRRTRASAERLSLQFQERVAERERIAAQIHDTVIQDMIGTALQLELLGFQISDQPQKAASSVDTLAQRLRETIARSRNMVWSLHSTAVVQYSLVEVLRHAEAEFRLGELPRFELSSSGEPRDVHPLVRDEVYRICREALANAFRHSDAQNVSVTVRFLPDLLEVEISDDGHGIDEETRLHGRPGHFGLSGMQAHAQRIGASIAILSAPGQGTKILLRVKTRQPTWRSIWQRWIDRGPLLKRSSERQSK
jgi:signal transduction histidine kinase/ligand-binding sensor domain-containing protein